jgi:hypothetical protein
MYRYIIFLFSIFLLSACTEDMDDPEVRIRNMVSAMESAVQQRSLDQVKELVSSDYKDQWNNDRRAALRSLLFYFQGHQSIHLLTRISDIQLNDDASQARVIVYVGMAGQPVDKSESLIALNADLYRFDVDLIADGDKWLVSSARWEKARVENFDF